MARPYFPIDLERRVRAAAANRCGYCQRPQSVRPIVASGTLAFLQAVDTIRGQFGSGAIQRGSLLGHDAARQEGG